MKPIKINNINSSLCLFNLKPAQDLHLRVPYNFFKINCNSNLLKLLQKESNYFEIQQTTSKLASWNYSNLYLGDVNILTKRKNHKICVFLDCGSNNFITIVNPKDQIFKIRSNQILEVVLYSDNADHFELRGNSTSKKLGYKIYENEKLTELFGFGNFQHHIWIKPNQNIEKNLILFYNNSGLMYNFLLEVKNSKVPNYYIKKIKIIKKGID
jgi:hypothetical protein